MLPLIPLNLSGAQGDALLVGIDADDLDQHLLPGLQDLRGAQLGRARHLADVKQPLNAQAELDEGAKIEHAGHFALHELIHLILIGDLGPGVRLEPLEAQRDACALPIQVEDVDLYLIAHLNDLTGIVHLPPGELRDVDEAVGAAEIHKGTEVRDACDRPGDRLAFRQFLHDALALHLLPGTPRLALREDQPAAVSVHLDDLEPYLVPHHLGQALPALVSLEAPWHSHGMGSRDEAPNSAKGREESSAVEPADLSLVELTRLHHLLRPFPVLAHQGIVDRENQAPLFILRPLHGHGDLIPRLDTLEGLVVQTVEVAGRDDAISFETSIDDGAAVPDLDNHAALNIPLLRQLVVVLSFAEVLLQLLQHRSAGFFLVVQVLVGWVDFVIHQLKLLLYK